MVGRKKKTKVCDKGHEEWISKLPDHLIYEILVHLPTKDVVTTSLLSTRWRNLWQCVPGLDLDSRAFSNINAFVSFAERFFDSHSHMDSWIHKLRLSISIHDSVVTPWIDAVTRQRIQHLDLEFDNLCRPKEISPSIFTCQTLVHLRLCCAPLVYTEFVSLPCLKMIDLEYVSCTNEVALQKLMLGSPALEDLRLYNCSTDNKKILQVRSCTLKRIHIDEYTEVEIDAPLLQCLKTKIYAMKVFKIINLGFSTKLDIDLFSTRSTYGRSLISDVLADISKTRDLCLRRVNWEDIFLYSESVPLLQFRHLSRLNAKFLKSDLEKLPTILESCPKLESLILELVNDPFMRHKKNREPKVMFSRVPGCMVSSLKFVELKRRSTSKYEGELELVRYFLKNSTILEKLKLDTNYSKTAMLDFVKELVAIPRCSSACEVLVL